MKILLVEDDYALRTVVARHLQRAGHQVMLAPNVPDGMDVYLKVNFDLVISDNDCPLRDAGRDWLLGLRDLGQKVLLMSGNRVKELDDLPFIDKPFASRDLFARIAEIWSPVDPPAPTTS